MHRLPNIRSLVGGRAEVPPCQGPGVICSSERVHASVNPELVHTIFPHHKKCLTVNISITWTYFQIKSIDRILDEQYFLIGLVMIN